MADPACPVPFSDYDRVVLAHGAGGRVMQRLIRELFVAEFGGDALARAHDGAAVALRGPVITTVDGFTVSPRVFPGGDLGSLAVHGTVNDLAMCGARPIALTCGFILEEGLPLEELAHHVRAMATAAREAGVAIVAGDTKVVERGKGDGVFITTTGLGELVAPAPVDPRDVRPGDAVLVSGPIGDHGVAVLSQREGLRFATEIVSDAASVHRPALALFEAGLEVHALRDPTRGGLAAVVGEIADTARVGIELRERDVPVRPGVADACELLGLDPLHVPCEGRFLAFVPDAVREPALAVLRERGCPEAKSIGSVVADHPGMVVLEGPTGGRRVLEIPAGEPLPRIC